MRSRPRAWRARSGCDQSTFTAFHSTGVSPHMRQWRPLAAPRAARYGELWHGGRCCGAAMRLWHCAQRCGGPGPRRGRRAARNCPRRNSNREFGAAATVWCDGHTLYGARAPERLEWLRRRLEEATAARRTRRDRRRRGPPAPRSEDETTAASDSRDATRRQPLGADGRAATRGSAAKPCILSLIECLARTPGQELALEISAAFPRVLSSLGDFQRPTRAATVHVRRPWLCNSRRGMRMLRHDARSVEIPTHACEIDAP